VNVYSEQCAATRRVAPGSPDTSYLIHKLAGDGPCFSGSRMPEGEDPLPASDQAKIRAWIAEGAPNN
jgi:hypothetical protein